MTVDRCSVLGMKNTAGNAKRDTTKATRARKESAAKRRFPALIEELRQYGFEVIDREGFLAETR